MILTKQDLHAIEEVLDRKFEPVKKDMKKMKKDLRGVIDFFDQEHQALRGRVDRIENILKIVKTS